MRTVRSAAAALYAAATLSFAATPAWAHAFGARYDLPLPLGLYLAGAGGAVALSFVIMAVAFRARPAGAGEPWTDLGEFRALRILFHPVVAAVVRAVAVALFVLVVTAGFLGSQSTTRNIAPVFVWIIWWVGLAYVAALAGNVWPFVNPWAIVFAAAERVFRRSGGRARPPLLAYPSWLGVWPAVILFGLFAWFELISEAGKQPHALATAIAIYSAIAWLGMAAVGREAWLTHGEAFSLAFGVFGRFAAVGAAPPDRPECRPGRWYLRPYASALVVTTPCRLSMTVFVLVMLATVTFDGFKETPLWGDMLRGIALAPAFHPVIRGLHDLGFDLEVVLATVVLALFPLLFLLVYLGFSWLAGLAAGSARPVGEIAGLFVFSLVPIAIAYHLAHYLSYLMIAGQLVIPLASDPFGLGWNLFGTADYAVDIGVIGAEFVWYAAVAAIVVGHVIAVGVAHLVALRVFATARAALRSQYPMLVLMVAYTMVSLWILSQPITGSPSLARLDAPSGSVSLAPFEFRELCREMAAGDVVRYAFRSDRPVEFDVHYHDVLAIHYPVRLAGVTGHAGRFVADRARTYCLMWFNRSLTGTSLTYRVAEP